MTRLNRIPVTGDTIKVEGFIIEVVDMDGLRVDKVLVREDDKTESKEG
jgi:putative hemolysin